MFDICIVIGCVISILVYFIVIFGLCGLFIDEQDNEKRDDLIKIFGIVSCVETIFIIILMAHFYV